MVHIEADLTEEEAEALALFLKRINSADTLGKTDAHLPQFKKDDQALQMMAGIDAIRGALEDAGYAPR